MEMNFGSLVRELNAVETAETVKRTRNTVEPTFSVSLMSYPDVVVTKETPKVRKHLILMPTQGLYYIKSESISGKGEPETVKITAENLTAFAHGCNLAFNDFWFVRLPANKKESSLMLQYLGTAGVAEMLKYHACPDLNYISADTYSSRNMWNKIERAYKSFKVCPTMYKDYAGNNRFKSFVEMNDDIIACAFERWGASGVRTMIEAIINSLVDVNSQWKINYYHYNYHRNIFDTYSMDLKTAVDYIAYTSVQMGYGDNMHDFFVEWNDCLDMQNKVYGKIREKYPDNLPTMHHRLSYQCRVNAEEIDASLFRRQHEKTVKYEWECNGYKFIAPVHPSDFRDEATQQANCLAGYISRYADGQDHIIFMRYAATPEKSLVTIELSAEEQPRLLQAYRARNTQPTDEEMSVIDAWMRHIKEEIV